MSALPDIMLAMLESPSSLSSPATRKGMLLMYRLSPMGSTP